VPAVINIDINICFAVVNIYFISNVCFVSGINILVSGIYIANFFGFVTGFARHISS